MAELETRIAELNERIKVLENLNIEESRFITEMADLSSNAALIKKTLANLWKEVLSEWKDQQDSSISAYAKREEELIGSTKQLEELKKLLPISQEIIPAPEKVEPVNVLEVPHPTFEEI